MRIAIIGSGISGLVAARLLARDHDVSVFEANTYVGGHTNTVAVVCDGRVVDVDTGFIVYNQRTYPKFVRLLEQLGVASKPTRMSFSVSCESSGLEYSSRAVFAQRRNLLRPQFYRMLADLVRFHRDAKKLLGSTTDELDLGSYLARGGYSKQFIHQHIIPMGAAIWSTDPREMLRFPARYFVRFFENHGLLGLNDQPQWRVIVGGSKQYIEPLTRTYADRIRLRCPVLKVRRRRHGVEILAAHAEPECFDRIVFATHSDQALAMLADATERERDILGALAYQENQVVLHTDVNLLPRRPQAWAAWNYHVVDQPGPVTVTYNMNILQGLNAPEQLCVTLNRTDTIDPSRVLRRFTYSHPLYTPAAVAAQRRYAEINGVDRTYFCGAYWGYGFHEDGVASAVAVGAHFGQDLEGSRRVWQERHAVAIPPAPAPPSRPALEASM
jgi:predicted NAD/FAD-binding protein